MEIDEIISNNRRRTPFSLSVFSSPREMKPGLNLMRFLE